jgi:hypothetical protein
MKCLHLILLLPVFGTRIGVLYIQDASTDSIINATLFALSQLTPQPDLEVALASSQADLTQKLNDLLLQNITDVFGGGDADFRLASLPTLKAHGARLWSPFPPAEECGNELIFTGSTINQYISHALHWYISHNPDASYVVVSARELGPAAQAHSDVVRAVVIEELRRTGGRCVGSLNETAVNLTSINTTSPLVNSIQHVVGNYKPAVVLSILTHSQHVTLIKSMWEANMTETNGFRVLAFGFDEIDSFALGNGFDDMHVVTTGSYFQSITSPSNTEFPRVL